MVCYLIERPRSNTYPTSMYLGSVALLEGKRWFRGAHVAIKFADRPSAQTVAQELQLDWYTIVEHMFG